MHEADLGLQSPATLQIPIGPAAATQAPAALFPTGLPAQQLPLRLHSKVSSDSSAIR
mgnify:CR=1 FL=1